MYQIRLGVSLTLTEQAKERQIREIMASDQQTECLDLIFESQDGNYYAKKCRNAYKTTWAYQQSQTYLIKKDNVVQIQDYKRVAKENKRVAKGKMLEIIGCYKPNSSYVFKEFNSKENNDYFNNGFRIGANIYQKINWCEIFK